jgi:hypothetical protein
MLLVAVKRLHTISLYVEKEGTLNSEARTQELFQCGGGGGLRKRKSTLDNS